MSEKRPYDPADIEVAVHTRHDGLRFFSVAGLKRGREYELLAIVAKMQAEDAAAEVVPSPSPLAAEGKSEGER